MRRLIVPILALILLAACSGDADEAAVEPGEAAPAGQAEPAAEGLPPAEEAAEAVLQANFRGQHGRAFDMLHPAQQELMTRDGYVECMRSNMPTTVMSEFEVVDTYEERTTIPGTDEEVDSVAVTWEADLSGEPGTGTNQLVAVDGEWRAFLTQEFLDRCAGTDDV